MDAKGIIKSSMNLTDMVVKAYVGDLSDAELLRRPSEGCNHIAFQLGHLISSEIHLLSGITETDFNLPEGFAENHSGDAASSDDASKFLTGKEYMDLYDQVRQNTLAAVDKMSADDFDAESPESLRSFAPTKGDVLNLIATHPMMHAGQFVIVRRQTGKPIVM
ncbi:MAG TPA: DinB family protein [Planctomycetaceae bacterium]|nr:DinB family protein [Planctomycetaceae bacterium]